MTTLARWDPFRDLLSLRHDIDRLYSGFGMPWIARTIEPTTPAVMVPSWDVMTRDEDLVIRAELPGVTMADIDISVTGDMLSVTAKRESSTEVKEEDYLVRESSFGRFERSMHLPEGAQVERIAAEYRDGILEIVVPKAAPAEPTTRRIEVHVPEHEVAEKTHH